MSKIDIVRRIANTEEGKLEMGLPDERKIQVSRDEDGFSFVYSDGYLVVPESKLETIVVRNMMIEVLPEDYKIEVTHVKTDDNLFCTKCSVHSTRNHHTLSFAYGQDALEATGKCLLDILKLKKSGEESYEEHS